ncbi:MAG TPA: sigma-70 family RNA polymerase sigma factor [Dyella sp.]|uniref:RNA polymerase sigma factor n=1 Tax=Dyella sp. TaxID=1869338 RepID=UPI002D795293|nr:sigma-70 family RNA polymerase sigma factor [Dyella sp.]HET6554675.1 sigma-70 family RNA polymerase sigma factor [Dyella sp.]
MDHVPALRRYFSRRVSPADVEDLVQEVLLRMQVTRDPPEIQHLDRYLFRVAGSVLTDRVRRGAVRQERLHDSLQDFHYPVEERTPERVILDQEALEQVVVAIERLPTRTREIFVLHRFEEMTCASIAEQLGLSVSAVEKHVITALATLRKKLKEP